MEVANNKKKLILAAALTGLIAGTTFTGTTVAYAGDHAAKKGDKAKCKHDRKDCKEKDKENCKHHKAKKKGDKAKCADGGCGDKKGK